MDGKIYQNQGATVFTVNMGEALTGATVTLEVTKPSGATASLSGSVVNVTVDGVACTNYGIQATSGVTASTTFDEDGIYTFQPKVVLTTSTYYGVPFEVQVYALTERTEGS